jgi:hypothetical protein
VLARTILAIDPEAAQRRREQAQKDPRIRRWREERVFNLLCKRGPEIPV